MSSRQGMIRTSIALAVAFALAAPLTASAQGAAGGAQPAAPRQGGPGPGGAGQPGGGGGGRGRGGAPPYTPAAGARDLRSVLHNWGWHLGMLRGEAEIDLIASLEYQGNGHHASGRAALQADGLSHQHQLHDFGSADSDHMARGPMDRRIPTSKSSMERTHGTKIFPVRSSSREKVKRRRWRLPPRSG